MFSKDRKGIVLIACYLIIAVLLILSSAFLARSVGEKRIAEKGKDFIQTFNIAEGGLEQAFYVLKQDLKNDSTPSWDDGDINGTTVGPDTANFYSLYGSVSQPLGGGSYTIELKNVETTGPDDLDANGNGIRDDTILIKSTGTFNNFSRTVLAQIEMRPDWLEMIPSSVYSNSAAKIEFDERDDAYIDGHQAAGVYSTGDIEFKKDAEERIDGNPPILENQQISGGLQDGIWDAFDLDGLRNVAKANGTYFSGDEYNKGKGKYTLPVEEGQTEGVFFFDTTDGEPLDDDGKKAKNAAKVELNGTEEQMSGVIVVVGDLTIKDTEVYDFLFDGVILVLDDLKIDDKKHHRRDGTNDSDIFIRGAVLSDDIIQKKKRKEGKKHRTKKPSMSIKNATIEHNPSAIINASSYAPSSIVLKSWQEL